MIFVVICMIIGYIFGCFLTAAVVVKIRTGNSVFKIGSKNPGMANVMANVGKKEGFLVLIGDILKTVCAVLICYFLSWDYLGFDFMMWTGLGCVLGHNYPVWNRFKGGKGVTVTVSYLVLGIPWWGAIVSIVGGIITVLTGDLWLGAILIPLMAVPFAFWKLGVTGGIIVIIMLIMMIQKNVDGIIKVLKGEEKRKFRNKK